MRGGQHHVAFVRSAWGLLALFAPSTLRRAYNLRTPMHQHGDRAMREYLDRFASKYDIRGASSAVRRHMDEVAAPRARKPDDFFEHLIPGNLPALAVHAGCACPRCNIR